MGIVESRDLEANDLICETIYRIEVEPDQKNPIQGSNPCEYMCSSSGIVNGKKDKVMYCLTGVTSKMKTDQNMNFPQGESGLIIENGNKYRYDKNFTISLPSDARIDVVQKSKGRRGRRLITGTTTPFPFEGEKRALVIRVKGSGSNEEVAYDKDTLSRRIFGGPDDLLNLKSGYAACSDSRLNIEKANDNTQINEGILEVQINQGTTGESPFVLENIIASAAKTKLSVTSDLEEIYDLVLMCLPPGTSKNAIYDWTCYFLDA